MLHHNCTQLRVQNCSRLIKRQILTSRCNELFVHGTRNDRIGKLSEVLFKYTSDVMNTAVVQSQQHSSSIWNKTRANQWFTQCEKYLRDCGCFVIGQKISRHFSSPVRSGTPLTCFPIELGAMLPAVSWFCAFVQIGKKLICTQSYETLSKPGLKWN